MSTCMAVSVSTCMLTSLYRKSVQTESRHSSHSLLLGYFAILPNWRDPLPTFRPRSRTTRSLRLPFGSFRRGHSQMPQPQRSYARTL